jgi:site-specific recombinase XerD
MRPCPTKQATQRRKLTEALLLHLQEQNRSARTVDGYAHALRLFAGWFEHINGEPLTPAALTLAEAREYRENLLRHKARPAIINRHLATLKADAT